MRRTKGVLRRTFYSTIVLLAMTGMVINSGNITVAMTADQRRMFDMGITMYDTTSICGQTDGADSSGIQGFVSQPIDSTWSISDSTVEQWFLQQAGAKPVITRYGLNSGNIGSVTSVVKEAGVSPVFFYTYAVNEGGGAGGFINHWKQSAMPGTAVADAKKDAGYLAAQSQDMSSKPSWIDAGNPVDFVPQGVKDSGNATFQSMPAGTIGRAYIPSTAAATWEVFYPDGLKKAFNKVQNYGNPLQDMMNNIRTMGGNPAQGGSGSDMCPPTTTASDIVGIAGQLMGYFTYSQPNRKSFVVNNGTPDSITSVADINRNGQTDCSGFIWIVAKLAGFKVPSSVGWSTGSMTTDATGAHNYLQEIPASEAKAGDIIIGTNCLGGGTCGHTALLAEDYNGTATAIIHMTLDSGSTKGVRRGTVGSFKYTTIVYARLVGKAS